MACPEQPSAALRPALALALRVTRRGSGAVLLLHLSGSLLAPLAREFRPQLVLVSAGFDTHYDDPIGGMRLTERGYRYLADTLLGIADAACKGKIVFVLEGGYDLGALRTSVKAVLETLLDGMPQEIRAKVEQGIRDTSAAPDIVAAVRDVQEPFWKCLRDV